MISDANLRNYQTFESEVGMVFLNFQTISVIVINHLSVKAPANYSGYSFQYLRRLLRTGKLVGVKISQVWLIEIEFLDYYLSFALNSKDQRFYPK
jgi:hypothetical protein